MYVKIWLFKCIYTVYMYYHINMNINNKKNKILHYYYIISIFNVPFIILHLIFSSCNIFFNAFYTF